jgi:hypothetical protein
MKILKNALDEKFPKKVICFCCKSEILLENSNDVYIGSLDTTYSWDCPCCNQKNSINL